MKKIIFAALAVVAIASCAKQESQEGESTQAIEVTFTSGISSRVSGNEWDKGDRVAIAAIYPVTTEVDGTFYYPMTPYLADQSGTTTTFTVESPYSALYFGSAHNDTYNPLFVYALYPYSMVVSSADSADDYIFMIDITDQSDLGKIDALMASNMATTSTPTVNLEFYHTMAMVSFNIELGDSSLSLDDMEFWIEDIATMSDPTSSVIYSSYDTEYGTIEGVVEDGVDDMHKSVDMILFSTFDLDYSADGIPNRLYDYTDAYIMIKLGDQIYYTEFITALYLGYKHTFNISIGAEKLTIGDATISSWDDSDTTITELPLTEDDQTTLE